MTGTHKAIELYSSSDVSSSSDSEPRGPRQQIQDSASSSEEKAHVKASKRHLKRSLQDIRITRKRRKTKEASSENESCQESEEDEMMRFEQLDYSRCSMSNQTKVAATTFYVAPINRPRHYRERQEITEGMKFYELQAQEQMMARFRAQKRRKEPVTQRPKLRSHVKARVVSGDVKQVLGKASQLIEKRSGNELHGKERAKKQVNTKKAQKSVPSERVSKKQHDGDSEKHEESEEEEWHKFTVKSAQREYLRKHHVQSVNAGMVENNRGNTDKRASRKSSDYHKPGRKQQIAWKMACTKQPTLQTAKRKTRQRVMPITPRNSLSEVESEQGSEEQSEEKSEDDEVELVALPVPRRQEKVKLRKKVASKRYVSGYPKQRLDENLLAGLQSQNDAAKASSRAVFRGTSGTQDLVEKMSLRELQEQEKLLLFFRVPKKRNLSGVASTMRKGGHNAHITNTRAKTNGSGRRARMGVNQQETLDTLSSLKDIARPFENELLAPNAESVFAAGCTATTVEKLTNPVIHSTAWRRLLFEETPPNILDGVSVTPYSFESERPLWAYDTTGELKEKIKFVEVDQGVVITDGNFENQPSGQSEVYKTVRALVEQELPQIKTCHARRVRNTLKEMRKHLSEYVKAHQVLHGERYRRLQWSEIASHQSWLSVSPTERVAVKRMLQNSSHTVQPYNYLVGGVRYFVQQDKTFFGSLVYPETVIHLPNDITAIRRSFTMIGIRKNAFVEDDTILRYVPYLGDGERMVIDNDLYSETTMSNERRIAVFGEGKELKASNSCARDDEIMEYILRVIVGKCGASEEVFLALQHEGIFDQPRIDYCSMRDLAKTEEHVAKRIVQIKEVVALQEQLPADKSAEMSAAQMNASKALCKLVQPHWFLRNKPEPQLLAIRLQPPLSFFESSYADSLETLGIHDRPTYEGLVESHRDLLCRRCYCYDCFEHGIQNPQRSIRADPIYPMVSVPEVVHARQEVVIQDRDMGAEDGSPFSLTSPVEVVELTSSSNSDDEERKSQQSSVDQSASQSTTLYRRSRRAHTRISSLASKSLQTQEKMLEIERLAELEKRKKRREKFARAADKSEYLDKSYLPAVTASLKKLMSKIMSCGPSCWLCAGDTDSSKVYAPLRQVDSVLVRKLASTLGPNACMISAMLKSPKCTCAQISRFLAGEKMRRDSGDNLETEKESLVPTERQREGRRSAGVGSNRSLAKRIREQRSYDREKRLSYEPCNHAGVCDETCECTKRGHSCNKACSCPRDCPNRFQGCKCTTGNCHTSACPCWSAGRECDPDFCFNCGASDAAVMTFHPEFKSRSNYNLSICHNVNMLRGSIQKKIGIAFSATHGWGAYALEPIRKDEFVLEYTGELITDDEAERRGALYDRKCVSYLFGVNSDYVVDAARKGNKAKFANHRAKEGANLHVKVIASNGEHRIGLFAREAIEVGAELFFDYGYTHDSAPRWSQHDKPQPEKRAYDIVDDENEWE
ncbi:unnamed protein product [Peronospora destructor]|uniref:[Histone H3]-lysine(27) N-trimethyltransferase n=1 Tax=Peronospora destructor TaxID=86335 RepID=A0AAV0UDW3_9STRA|nr:unnamed protein product [Peronospora destructor]